VSVVLDASALLAYWLDEPGGDVVSEAIAVGGASIGTPNLAEALGKLVDRRPELAQSLPEATKLTAVEWGGAVPGLPLAGGAITVEPFTVADAVATARLRPQTVAAGLSLGDRACLVLANRMGAPALTADRSWAGLALGIEVILIRPA
jgi:PIN domain nuclease of toxin-antitoxin system